MSTSQIWKKQFKGHFEGSVRAYVEGASVGRAFVVSLGMSSHCCGKNRPLMYRVGKSAAETEAETCESDLITVRSCAYKTGCFGWTHVFITSRLYARSPFGSQSQCTTQGRPCPNKASQIPRS